MTKSRLGKALRSGVALSLLLLTANSFATVCLAPGAASGLPKNAYFQGDTANAGSLAIQLDNGGTARTVAAQFNGTADTTAITAGDTIFIIQMQGADIDNSDSSSYGDGIIGGGNGYSSLNSTGLYEFATVASVSGSSLTLTEPLSHTYTSNAATAGLTRKTFQIIRVPRFYNFDLSAGTGDVLPWNGRTGGAYILDVVNNLSITGATIDASGAGFRGAGSDIIDPITNGVNADAFATDSTPNLLAAMKGEGIAGTPTLVNGGTNVGGYTGQNAGLITAIQGFAGDLGYPNGLVRGRGGAGNAGGGGVEHNAGGAGGSNFGVGGGGGASFAFYETTNTGNCTQYDTTFFACDGDGSRPVGGIAGAVLTKASIFDYQSRLFMGGGGGGGSSNNAADDTAIDQSSGGSGGGIVVVRATTISGGGSLNIITNGGDGESAGRDGAGGGGAGGTALVLTTSPSPPINITANGGAGGNTGHNPAPPANNLADGETQGPGGGGGGGAALIAAGVSVGSISTAGGIAGVNRPDETIPSLINPLQAGSGGGTSVEVDYNPEVISVAGDCGEDFGDAPASYGDASHILIRQIFMGAQVPDDEITTLADDNSVEAIDEDGLLTLPTLTTTDTSYSVDVLASNNTGVDGDLYGWIDLNNDGDFDDAGEAATSVVVSDGSTDATFTLTWSGLSGLVAGSSHMRIRVTTDAAITTATPASFAEDGEVEDHPISILLGGAVCSYPGADGIWHLNGDVTDSSANNWTPASNDLVTADFNADVYGSSPSAPLFDGTNIVNLDGDATGTNGTFLNAEFSEMSVTFWLKPESFTGTQTIWDEGGATNGVAIRLNGTTLEARLADGNVDIDLSAPFPQDNRWHHIGLVYDFNGATADVELFIDGVSAATANGHTSLMTQHSSAARLGSANQTAYGVNDFYTGYIDEVVYWTNATVGVVPAASADLRLDMPTLAACHTPVIREDYGDAPDTTAGSGLGDYATLDANEGPRHMLGADLYLGDVIADDDVDANPNTNASGDDSGDGVLLANDEGVAQLLNSGASTLAPIITTDTSYQIVIDVTNNEATAANLYAWLDTDFSGTFDDTELATGAIINVPNAGTGTATITWSSLSGLTPGDAYIRLRLTTDTLTNNGGAGAEDTRSLGYAGDGEVEDYIIEITSPPDFGDAPAVYGDAWHDVSAPNNVFMGVNNGDGEVTTLLGGDAGAGADGDDTDGSDDEDALDAGIPDLNINDTSYVISIPLVNGDLANQANLVAWLDFDGDNVFDDDEFASSNAPANSTGNANLVWSNIGSSGPDIVAGTTYLRLRFTTDISIATGSAATSSSINGASDGEIEDYEITILGSDFGDAPATYGDASHNIVSSPVLFLGTGAPDEDPTTQLEADSGLNADGDDNDGFDDENGVASFTAITDAIANIGTTYTVAVNVTNTGASANVMGWIDFNGNGSFDIPTEAASAAVAVATSSTVNLSFVVPADIAVGTHYARIRLTTDAVANTDTTTAFSDGEVEDYPFTVSDSTAHYFEAECGVSGNEWTAVTDPAVSRSTYVEPVTGRGETTPGGGAPATDYLEFNFGLTAGNYDVYALVNYPGIGSNSMATSFDNTTWTLFNNGGFHTSSIWDWRPVLTNITSTGTIQFFVGYMEAGAGLDKFAFVANGAPAPTGLGDSAPSCFDFGDAADTSGGNGSNDFTTTLLNGGPYHADSSTALFLGGTAADFETDGIQSTNADGDDSADELESELVAGGLPAIATGATSYGFTANTRNDKAVAADLYAWIDANKNGLFEDTELAAGAPYSVASGGAGTTAVSWTGLSAVTAGDTIVRLRITSDQGFPAANGGEDEGSLGVAIDGEVEDHKVTVFNFDYGDAPVVSSGDYDDTNNDGTITGADDPARHAIVSGINLGTDPDADSNVWGNNGIDDNNDASDDDSEGATPDDETGISTLPALADNDSNYALTLTVNNGGGIAANIYAWIDFDGNGSFDEDERATVTGGVSSGGQIPATTSGSVTLDWPAIPAGLQAGISYVRVRISSDDLDPSADGSSTDDASLGPATNGEVEDYQITISSSSDFGDAPASFGSASHTVSANVFLGALQADVDNGTQLGGDAGVGADGDDGDGSDDEDGLAAITGINDGNTSYQLTLSVNNTSGSAANLYAWLDFDGNGVFDQDERAVLQDGTIDVVDGGNVVPDSSTGTVVLDWASTPGISIGTQYLRVRMTTATIDNTVETTSQDDASIGGAADGEVEDYELIITDSTQVFFEAECGITGNVWRTLFDPVTSQQVFIQQDDAFDTTTAPTGAQPAADLIQYDLTVPLVGSYDVYVLVDIGPGTVNDDSFYLSSDNNNWTTVNNLADGGWVWEDTTFNVTTTGVNEAVSIFLHFRENGVSIDKFALIPSTGGTVPTGLGVDIGSCFDFGDAPDTTLDANASGDYTTLIGNTVPGGFSTVDNTPTVFMGDTAPDTENDAVQNATASGDGSDESESQLISTLGGDAFPTLTTLTSSYSFEIDITNSKAVDATLMAWVDFDRNGLFDESERADANPTIAGSAGSVQQTITWSSLAGLTSGDTFMRLRLTTDTSFVSADDGGEDALSLGVVIDGETEDHLLTIVDIDFGDAPVATAGDYDDTDASGTVDGSDNPARHLIVSGINFGTDPDSDSGVWGNGVDANNDASDDDTEGTTPDDEDGVTLVGLVTSATSYGLSLNVNNSDASNAANVYAWVDFDQSGSFDEDEIATVSGGVASGGQVPAATSGSVNLDWASLPGIASGNTYVRLRITTDSLSAAGGGLDERSIGLANDGEVEDYQLDVAGVDFGDAPIVSAGDYDDTNSSGAADSGDNAASHAILANIRLGSEDPDGEALPFSDGTDAGGNATDDDTEGATPDDEDGISSFAPLLQSDASYQVTLSLNTTGIGSSANVYGWIDFNQNGSFDENERATLLAGSVTPLGLTVPAVSDGTVVLNWSGLSSLSAGAHNLRARITTDNLDLVADGTSTDDASLGFANDGEVEDYQLTILAVDYGDAPIAGSGSFDDTNSSGAVTAADAAAVHGIVNGIRLGATNPDADTGVYGDGTDTNTDATDDDTTNDPSGGVDDEDGLASLPVMATNASSLSATLTLANSAATTANVYAWIDFDADGLWEESERATLSAGTVTPAGLTIPASASGTVQLDFTGLPTLSQGTVYMRVRITTDDLDLGTEGANVQDDAATGAANDGEVEDYAALIVPALDYGDVPIASAGDYDDGNTASHFIQNGLQLGANAPDVDSDAWGDGTDANNNASDDDSEGSTPDDEDGIASFGSLLTSTSNYSLSLSLLSNVGLPANVFAWIDFDGNKEFDEDELASLSAGSITPTGLTVPNNASAGTINLDWTVPSDISAGTTYVRVRITTDALTASGGGVDERAEGAASNGEIEDYEVIIEAIDFGDAPDTSGGNGTGDYSSLSANNGPSHAVINTLFLGSTVADGDTNAFENGTDTTGTASDDENGGDEGVAQLLSSGTAFPSLESTDTTYSLSINAFNNTGGNASIYAWIDLDKNGLFDEDELASGGAIGISSSASLQVKTVQWTSLPEISSGATFMRVRITTNIISGTGAGVDERSVGALTDGEVEDYVITVGNLDYGDAPAPYKTLFVDDGPRHTISNDLYLGDSEVDVPSNIFTDLDTDGYGDGVDNNGNASDDDVSNDADENLDDLLDGASVFPTLFSSATSYPLSLNFNNQTGSAARIYAWIDFDQSGTFDVDEAIDGLFGQGDSQTAALNWASIPNDIQAGVTYARFRISSTPLTAAGSGEDVRSLGLLANGEVEDHQITIAGVDFGDAPSSYGTFLASGGPRHIIGAGTLFIGTNVPDGDKNGFGNGVVDNPNATDDDTENSADEGIADLLNSGAASFPILDANDTNYSLTIDVSNSAGSDATLHGWIDFDNDGSFDDVDERTDITVVNGTNDGPVTLLWTVPGDVVVSATYARFRIRLDNDASILSGGEASAGEVEDYQINISGDTAISGRVFEDINYGGGDGRNYITANASFSSTDVGTPATVELWASDGITCTVNSSPLLTTTADAGGVYSFTGATVAAPADYCVRVVTDTVASNRSGYVVGLVPVQTYRAESTDGVGSIVPIVSEIGGRFPSLVDTDAGVEGFDFNQTSSWSIASTNGPAITNLDFGFNFNTIVNTNVSAQGSLDQFMRNANALSNANIAQVGQTALIDVSIFEIPTADVNYNLSGQGEFTISPTALLPVITDPIEVNGETQNGASCPTPIIEVSGAAAPSGNGIDITAGASLVRGLIINNWGTAGIELSGADNNAIECNYIGTNAAGSLAAANNIGIDIFASSNSNTVGGTFATQVNVISGNSATALNISSNQNQVFRNQVGLAADGVSRLDNGAFGIAIQGSDNIVGNTSANNANTIAYNSDDGINITAPASQRNSVRVNTIYNNAGLGINLEGAAGIDSIDVSDVDTGPNSLLNAPLLNAGTIISGNDLVIDATLELDSRSTPIYTLELYANPVCNSDQTGAAQGGTPAGEGFQFVGSFGITGTTTGTNAFSNTLSGIVSTLQGGVITAKLVEDGGDTSEFSNCIQVAPPQVISGTVFEDVLYGGGFGRDATAPSAIGVPATVELWTSDGVNCTGTSPVQSAATNGSGVYSFTTATLGAEYCVRVANSTVQSSRGSWVPGIVPIQTYQVNGVAAVSETGLVGGLSPRDADSAPGVMDTSANDGTRTQSIAMIDGPAAIGIDFGFNFSTVVNGNSSGQGSLSQFILNANNLTPFVGFQDGDRLSVGGGTESFTSAVPTGTEASIFMVSNGVGNAEGLANNSQNLLGGGDVAEITLSITETITRTNISIDGTTQTINVTGNDNGAYNSGATVGRLAAAQGEIRLPDVQLTGGGINVAAVNTQVRGIAFLPTTTALNIIADDAIIEQNGFGVSAVSFVEPGGGSSADLVIVNNADQGALRNNAFGFGSQNGLQYGNGSLNWVIEDNLWQGFSQAGITTTGNYACASFDRNQLTANNQGIEFVDGTGFGNCLVNNSTINENTQSGVDVNVGAGANINMIGNLITENGGDGVAVIGATSTQVLILENHIFNNGDLGIDLENDNAVTSGEGGGANLHINIPVINSITADGDDVTVSVTATSGQTGLQVELYSSAVCNGDTAGVSQALQFGEGEKWHTPSQAATSGVAFNIVVATNTDPLAGDVFTAILRDTNGNTSEFSACVSGLFNDYGDAPDTYGTNLASNGARHRLTSDLSIGASVADGDAGSNASAGADGDDLDGSDDEDIAGLTLPTLTTASFSYTITVSNVVNTVGSAAELTGWIDFDGNGTFDTDEAASVTVNSSGSFDLDWVEVPTAGQGSIPVDIANGSTFLRLRLSTDSSVLTGVPGTSSPIGLAIDGEVEDYPFTIGQGFDYGDAPDGSAIPGGGTYSFNTIDGNSPARHALANNPVYFGVVPPDGDNSAFGGDGTDNGYRLNCSSDTGTGKAFDDDCEGIRDEDGAEVTGLTPNDTSLDINAIITNNSGGNIFAYAWLDLDQDGTFDAGEGIEPLTVNPIATAGSFPVTFRWTGFAGLSASIGEIYVRLRVSTAELTAVTGFAGDAPDGEVEDYRIVVSDLTCNVIYGQYTNGTTFSDMRSYTVGNLSGVITNTSTANSVGSASTALDPITKRYYYGEFLGGNADGDANTELFYFDGAAHSTSLGNIIAGGGEANYNRMAFDPDGVGFTMLSGTPFTIRTFNTVAGTSQPHTVTVVGDPSGVDFGVGGDIAFDIDGNLYLVTYNTATATAKPGGIVNDQFYLYKINKADLGGSNAATLVLSRDSSSASVAGIAFFTNDHLFMQASDGDTYEWDLSSSTPPAFVEAVTGSADLASCIYPKITPVVDINKTVANITDLGSAGFTPGDILEYTMTIRNTGALVAQDVTFSDQVPANTTYIVSSTTLEQVTTGSSPAAVADNVGNFPFEAFTQIESAGAPLAGELVSIPSAGSLDNAVIIKYRVQVNSASSFDTVCNNSALIDYDDPDDAGSLRIIIGSNDPTTSTPAGTTNGDTETSDPTCLDKVSGYGIFGSVYEDVDVDETFDDPAESGISGVTMVLRNDTLATCTGTTTAADGSYQFFPLDLGDYTVYEAVGESVAFPSCPPTEADPNGYTSSTVNNIDVTIINDDIVDQNFGDVQPPLFTPNNAGIVQPGESIVYSHTLTPRTDGSVTFSVAENTIPTLAGWSVTMNNDLNCNGSLENGEPSINSSIAATGGVDLCILTRVTAPVGASAANQHIATVTANFDYPGTFVSNTLIDVIDTTTVVSADDGALLLIKTVENITASSDYFNAGVEQISNEGVPGDELLYRVKFQNVGSSPITNIDIFDTTPAFTELSLTIPANCEDVRGALPSTIPVQIPGTLTCTVIVDGGSAIGNNVGYTGSIQWQLLGTLAAGEQGFVVFTVTIN